MNKWADASLVKVPPDRIISDSLVCFGSPMNGVLYDCYLVCRQLIASTFFVHTRAGN